MPKLRFEISMSLDGFVTGPDPSEQDPLGVGGEQLHEWVVKLATWRERHGYEGGEVNASSEIIEQGQANVGAAIIGRGMFGGGPGPWGDDPWDGWWGDEPPFHYPVFVLTHHEREPVVKQGGTSYTFVTDGIESALEQAMRAADGKDVAIGGGADVAQQYLRAGLLDELQLNVVPMLLHSGTPLFANLEDADVKLEPTWAVTTPDVTHLKYRVVR